MQDMSRAPMPMRAPAEKPRARVVAGSCAAFFSAVAHTVCTVAGKGGTINHHSTRSEAHTKHSFQSSTDV